MKPVLVTALIFLYVTLCFGIAEEADRHQPQLFAITIENYSIENATFKEALDHLHQLTKKVEPKLNLSFVIEADSEKPPQPDENPRKSFIVRDKSVGEIILYLSSTFNHGHRWKVEGTNVRYLSFFYSGLPTQQRMYYYPTDLMGILIENAGTETTIDVTSEIRSFIAEKGAGSPDSIYKATYIRKSKILIVRGKFDELSFIKTGLEYLQEQKDIKENQSIRHIQLRVFSNGFSPNEFDCSCDLDRKTISFHKTEGSWTVSRTKSLQQEFMKIQRLAGTRSKQFTADDGKIWLLNVNKSDPRNSEPFVQPDSKTTEKEKVDPLAVKKANPPESLEQLKKLRQYLTSLDRD